MSTDAATPRSTASARSRSSSACSSRPASWSPSLVVGHRRPRPRCPAGSACPVTVAAALAVTQWLARGMTSPLREMTAAAPRMATRRLLPRVTATSRRRGGGARPGLQHDGRRPRRRRPAAPRSSSRRSPTSCGPRSPPSRPCSRTSSTASCAPTTPCCGPPWPRPSGSATLVGDLLDLSRGRRRPRAARPRRGRRPSPRRARRGGGRRLRGAAPSTSSTYPPTCTSPPTRPVSQQVLANLLDNADRHSPPGGRVTVSAGPDGPDRWWLEVADEGTGIPAEHARRVFDRFGSGDDARRRHRASGWPSPAGSASCTAGPSPP